MRKYKKNIEKIEKMASWHTRGIYASCMLALFLTGCGSPEWNLPLNDFILDHTETAKVDEGTLEGGGYHFTTRFVRRTDGTIVIPPATEEPESRAWVSLLNPRNFDLALSIKTEASGAAGDITAEQDGADKINLAITGAAKGDEYRFGLGLKTTDGVRDFGTYQLPAIRSYSFKRALVSLAVSAGSLAPAFSPEVTAYTLPLSYDVKVLNITASPDADAVISGPNVAQLRDGPNPVELVVTAQNGVSTQTYTITANRAKCYYAEIVAFDYGHAVSVTLDTATTPETFRVSGPATEPLTGITPVVTLKAPDDPADEPATWSVSDWGPGGDGDFSESWQTPVVYTVTAADGTTKDYAVQVLLTSTAVVAVRFSGLPTDENITERETPLSWTANPTLAVTVNGSFTSYEWYLDGELNTAYTGAQVSIPARNFTVGTHRLTCRLIKSDGTLYSSKTVVFEIVQ